MGELQEEQKKILKDQKDLQTKSNDKGNVISFESLELFRLGLKDLILKAELDLDLRSKIMKLIVHKIEILTDGFEIHFRVGENHYIMALEENSSNASFFVSFSDDAGKRNPKNKKAPEVLASEALKSNLKGAQDFLHFHAIARSRRLTNGGQRGN